MGRPLNLFWFIPTSGDGRYLGTELGHRPADPRYLRELAVAADRLGFGGVLLPTGKNCEDSWVTAAGIAPLTERLRFLVAIRPGNASPSFYARQAAALDRLSNSRLLLNLVAGGSAAELAGDGIFLDHDTRYAQADEFLTIWRKLMSGETVDHDGRFLKLSHAPCQAACRAQTPLERAVLCILLIDCKAFCIESCTNRSRSSRAPKTEPLQRWRKDACRLHGTMPTPVCLGASASS